MRRLTVCGDWQLAGAQRCGRCSRGCRWHHLEGRKQREQVLGLREQRLVAAGWRGRLCTDEGDVIIFLEPGEGASREGALSLL